MPPPGPAYNLLCVLTSAADILSHAARIRAAQVTAASRGTALNSSPRKRHRTDVNVLELVENERILPSASVDPGLKENIIRKDLELRNSYFNPTSVSANTPPHAIPLTLSQIPEEVQVHTYKAVLDRHSPVQEKCLEQPIVSSGSSSSVRVDLEALFSQAVSDRAYTILPRVITRILTCRFSIIRIFLLQNPATISPLPH